MNRDEFMSRYAAYLTADRPADAEAWFALNVYLCPNDDLATINAHERALYNARAEAVSQWADLFTDTGKKIECTETEKGV